MKPDMDMEKCELEVLISTFGSEGLRRVVSMGLPVLPGVGYLVSCQCPGRESLPIPVELMRPDIRIVFSATQGLSVNRNNAIRHASAPFCLIADDDLRYSPAGLSKIISFFRDHPDVDIATFAYTDSRGKFEKSYAGNKFPLDTPSKGYFVSSIEIAFRRERVVATGVTFNERFGLGCQVYGSGEEELWVKDLLDAGLEGYFVPVVIARHIGPSSTGLRRSASPAVLRAQGAVIKRLYPYTAFMRILLKARRASKERKVSIGDCLPPLLYGWWHATVNPRKLFGHRPRKLFSSHENEG